MTPAAQWNSSYIWFQKCLLALKRLFFGSHIKAIRPSSKEAICWKRRCFLICWVALNLYHRPKIERSKPKIPQDVSFVKNRRKENTRSRLRQVVDDQLENKKPIFFLNALNFSWKKKSKPWSVMPFLTSLDCIQTGVTSTLVFSRSVVASLSVRPNWSGSDVRLEANTSKSTIS